MSDWTAPELKIIDSEDEIHLSSHRSDGSVRPAITMWTVHVGGDVVVRSARQVNPWFTRALESGTGRIRIGNLEANVSFELFEGDGGAIDAAYHDKYDRYGSRIVAGVVGASSYTRTLRLTPTN
jgi:hypothetical protein